MERLQFYLLEYGESLNVTYKIQKIHKNFNLITLKKKNEYFDVNGFSYDEEHLKHFCNWNSTSKTNGLSINCWTTIRSNTLYRYAFFFNN